MSSVVESAVVFSAHTDNLFFLELSGPQFRVRGLSTSIRSQRVVFPEAERSRIVSLREASENSFRVRFSNWDCVRRQRIERLPMSRSKSPNFADVSCLNFHSAFLLVITAEPSSVTAVQPSGMLRDISRWLNGVKDL